MKSFTTKISKKGGYPIDTRGGNFEKLYKLNLESARFSNDSLEVISMGDDDNDNHDLSSIKMLGVNKYKYKTNIRMYYFGFE